MSNKANKIDSKEVDEKIGNTNSSPFKKLFSRVKTSPKSSGLSNIAGLLKKHHKKNPAIFFLVGFVLIGGALMTAGIIKVAAATNIRCDAVEDSTRYSDQALLSGSADNVLPTEFMVITVSETPGGPYTFMQGPAGGVQGNNTVGQTISNTFTPFTASTDYYFRVEIRDGSQSGATLQTSTECTFQTRPYDAPGYMEQCTGFTELLDSRNTASVHVQISQQSIAYSNEVLVEHSINGSPFVPVPGNELYDTDGFITGNPSTLGPATNIWVPAYPYNAGDEVTYRLTYVLDGVPRTGDTTECTVTTPNYPAAICDQASPSVYTGDGSQTETGREIFWLSDSNSAFNAVPALNDRPENIDQITLLYSTTPGGPYTAVSEPATSSVGNSVSITGLTPNTTYYYKVQGNETYESGGQFAESPECTFSTDFRVETEKSSVFNDENNDGFAQAGETITYTYKVNKEDTGNFIYDVVVTEDPGSFTGTGPVPVPVHISGGLNIDSEGDAPDMPKNDHEIIYEATYTITADDVQAGEVLNQSITNRKDSQNTPLSPIPSFPPGGDPQNPTPTPTALPGEPNMQTEKSAVFNDTDNDGFAQPGETITYTYTTTNTGMTDIYDVTVSEDAGSFSGTGTLPTPTYVSGGGVDLGGGPSTLDIAQGSTTPIIHTATYTLTDADIVAGTVTNQAIGNATDPSGDPVGPKPSIPPGGDPEDPQPTPVPLPQETKVATEKSSVFNDVNNDGYAQPGETITYTYTTTNTGYTDAFDIVTTESPAGFTGTGTLPVPTYVSGGSDIDGDGDAPDLAQGSTDTVIYTAVYSLTEADVIAGSVDNQAITNANDPDGNPIDPTPSNPPGGDPENPTPTPQPLPQETKIQTEKAGVLNDTNGDGKAQEGETITYTYTTTNTGFTDAFDIVTVEDPAKFTGTGTPPSPVYVSGGSDIDGDGDAPDLAQGSTDAVIYTASYTVTAEDVAARTIYNQSITSANDPDGNPIDPVPSYPPGGNPENPVPTPVPSPGPTKVETEKTAVLNDTNGDGYAQPGETITYTYKTTNTGESDVFDIVVTEDPASFTGTGTLPVPAYVSGGSDIDGDGDAPDLAQGSTDMVIYNAIYALTQEDINSGNVSNQAITNANDPEGNPIDPVPSFPPGGDPLNPMPTPLLLKKKLAFTGASAFILLVTAVSLIAVVVLARSLLNSNKTQVDKV